ncbi:MAG: TIM barrel protein [Phycisphaerales bacterium]
MLLTLTARSLSRRLQARGRQRLDLADAPEYTIEHLSLRGLVVDTALLKGWPLDALDRLRNRADQAGCPCLILRESTPISVASDASTMVEKSQHRVELVTKAAHRLGCNAVAVSMRSISSDREFDATAEFLRQVMERVDRMEMNLLVEPGPGMLSEPDSLINLIKKVGGFRIGTMPSFEAAACTDDCVAALRQTAPYASAVLATCPSNDKGEFGKKERTQLRECVEALLSVGYEQILAIDFTGDGDADATIDAVRDEIVATMEQE